MGPIQATDGLLYVPVASALCVALLPLIVLGSSGRTHSILVKVVVARTYMGANQTWLAGEILATTATQEAQGRASDAAIILLCDGQVA
jgi:hypothetical protein